MKLSKITSGMEADFWSGKLTVEEIAEQSGYTEEAVVQHLLFETETGRLLARNLREFREETRRVFGEQLKLLPEFFAKPVEQLRYVFDDLLARYKEEEELSQKLSIARELRQIVDTLLRHQPKEEVKVSKISEIRSDYEKVFKN